MHPLLCRQIKRHFGDKELPPELSHLINAIDQSYSQNDRDRELLERSLELSSQELNERYEGLEQQLQINKAAQRNLEHTLSLLDATLDATEEGILVVDRSHRLVKFNEIVLKILGVPKSVLVDGDYEEHLREALSKVAHPDQFLEKIKQLHSDPMAESLDIIELHDGRVLERFTRPQILQGECIGRVWSYRDITEKKAAEANLELARRVFEVSSQGILITDAAFQIIDVNRSLCEMLGKGSEQLLGNMLQKIEDQEQALSFNETFMQQMQSQGEWWGELRSGSENTANQVIWIGFSVVRNNKGEVSNYVGMFSDITKLKEVEDQLQQLAYYDPLTGLPNRRLFKERIEDRIDYTKQNLQKLALLYLDLDRFKFVNDSLGHLAGDQLLVQVSARIKNEIRSRDLISRQGGDEFTIALLDLENESTISEVAARIIVSLSKSFQIKDQEIYIGASIGICVLPAQATTFEEAVRNADTAMYLAKASGKGRFCFWDKETQAAMESRIVIETELREAIKQDQLIVYFQPIMDCGTGETVSLEALLRWQQPKHGLVNPDTFIPIAEEIGLITELENWVIDNVCCQLHTWREQDIPLIPISVNLSAQHLSDFQLEQRIVSTLSRHDVQPDLLSIEITESTAMNEPQETVKVLRGLQAHGIHSAIDDFGTGYSSLSYLKQLPVDKLKIDRSFVRDLTSDPNDRDIAKAIVDLAHSLSMKTVAEGVEDKDQLNILREMGCDLVQGWLFAKALSANDMAEFLLQNRKSVKPILPIAKSALHST